MQYANEINPLISPDHTPRPQTVAWNTPGLRITRLRYVGDTYSGLCDLSYCHGTLADGTPVRVQVPVWQSTGRTLKRDLYRAAQRDGIYLNKVCGGHLDDVLSRIW